MNTATKIDPTAEALIEMFTEDTGTHMLDSGSVYGRNWQRNQERCFIAEPEATLDTRFDKIDLTINTFHFLNKRLEYDPECTKALHEFGESNAHKDEPWLTSMEEWVEELAANDTEIYDVIGDGEPFTINTYNHDSLLSQVIQYHYWTEFRNNDYKTYIALQIHGGCDVRGGYTKPRVFHVCGEGTDIFDDAHADLACDNPNCSASWYTDDAYHWYPCNDTKPVLTENIVKAEDDDEGPRKGITYISDDGLFCPCCGTGKLIPWAPPTDC